MRMLNRSHWAALGTACAFILLAGMSCTSEYTKNSAVGWTRGTAEHSVAVGSDNRTFLLHVPPLRPRNRIGAPVGFPLVVMLHGSGADGETIRTQSQIEPLADSQRFVVAYPNGTSGLLGLGSDWNAGDCCGSAARSNVDDVAFIRAMIADVSLHLPIDRRRIFVAGFSDGARMAYRMACDAAPVVASIAVVSGSLRREKCVPARPVPVIAFHGTDDPEVAYDDSARTLPPRAPIAASAGLPSSIRFWSVIDGCTGVAVRRLSPHVTRSTFGPCSGANVVFYTIDGGRHAWPGGEKDGSSGAEPSTEIAATGTMWQFFLRHPLR